MSAAKLKPAEIQKRLHNIDAIYQDYTKKIERIRSKERNALSAFIKKINEQKLTEVRQSIRQEYK